MDDEADLRALLQHDLSGTETGAWLQESGVAERLRLASQQGRVASGNLSEILRE